MTSEKICFSARDGVRLEGLEQTPDAARHAPAGTRPPAASKAPARMPARMPVRMPASLDAGTLDAGTLDAGAFGAGAAVCKPGSPLGSPEAAPPAGTKGELAPAVVITHSHPLQAGGHMYAHVLRAVASELLRRGFVVLRFNFRGVQGSAGAFGDGRDELHDVGGAVDYLRARPHIAPDNVALFGYSFGSRVCLPYAAGDARIRAVATLGMPARRFLHAPPAVHAPVLLVAGSADRVIPPEHLDRFMALYPNASARILQGADHFYRGREREVGAAVADFLARLML